MEEPNLGFVSSLIELASAISFVSLAARFFSAMRSSSSISSVTVASGSSSLDLTIDGSS